MRNVILFICMISAVAALSVSPASHNIDLHSGTEQYTITVTNDEPRTLSVTITPAGPLQALTTIPSSVELKPGTSSQLPVSIKIPSDTQPGTLESGILFESRPVGTGTVAASSAVMHVIRIKTPRNGTYISGELLSSAGIMNAPLYITLSLTNTGTEETTVTSTIHVSNQTIEPSTIDIKPGESKSVAASWTPERIGEYTVSATVNYENKETTLTNTIQVGNLSVTITNLRSSEFRIGEPFILTTTLNNEWVNELPAAMNITINQGGKIVVTGESTALDLKPFITEQVPIILESRALFPGPANVTVNVRYADRLATATYPATIAIDAFIISPGQPVPKWPIFIAGGLLVIIVLVTWFLTRRKK